jgi:uncharacterized membrane protein
MQHVQNDRPTVTGRTRTVVILLQKSILFVARYWFLLVTGLVGVILALGFLAPALMSEGQTEAGQAIYRFLAPHNHQLPHRSYFLFGSVAGIQSYSLDQVLGFGADPLQLEAFTGNADIGFKTALNHRMVAIFVAFFLGGLIWGLAGQRPQLSFSGLLVMALPLLIDGFSHMISESSGQGFRDGNSWAVFLTRDVFPAAFYQGTTVGSLNWLVRNITGLLFGLGLAWFLYTYLSQKFLSVRMNLEPKLRRAGAIR